MTSPFAAAIAAAAAGSPMTNGDMPVVPGRLLLADGDGLCYYCAGNDDTLPGEARKRLVDKLKSAAQACGAESVKIVTTARGSHKGYRYAVARVKPYQGQRTDSRRPKNWEALREYLEQGALPPGMEVELTGIAEADDLFSRYALGHPDCVIYTQDKDMRMVPGWHLDWLTHIQFQVTDEFRQVHAEKVWGRAWFWLQMLHGDSADNIPGLPKYVEVKGGKPKLCGPVTAEKLIGELPNEHETALKVGALYESFYGERWLVELLEQGVLLWMRNDIRSCPFNVAAIGNPFDLFVGHPFYKTARAEIMGRITEAMFHEEADPSGDADSEAATPEEEQHALRALFAPVHGEASGAGPRPLDGVGAGYAASFVQCPAGEGGEQLPPVRSEQPVGLPAWMRRLLAKA